MKPMLVGRVGVARMQFVGGPRDGESKVAPVGASVVVRVKAPKKPKSRASRGFVALSFFGSPDTEGEDWKAKQSEGVKEPPRRYALYLPEITDGKATGLLLFGGEFLYTDATPQA